MSIPQRLYRIAKHKLTELKDHIEALDDETQPEAPRPGPDMSRPNARRELNDAVAAPLPTSAPPPRDTQTTSSAAGQGLRTPEEIARGTRAMGSASGTLANAPASQSSESDGLLYHYRLLGLEPGADFSTVQNAYNRLAARADVSKFPAGSDDARIAEEIRKKLDASYKALQNALDETRKRFNQLEI